MESLKKMIRSWLDDTFPDMPEAERIALSDAMDVTMVEKVKEQSMRTFYGTVPCGIVYSAGCLNEGPFSYVCTFHHLTSWQRSTMSCG